MSITLAEIVAKSKSRSQRWHEHGEPWTPSDWAVATAGEHGEFVGEVLELFKLAFLSMQATTNVGEALNALKKLRRIETDTASINAPGRQLGTVQAAKDKIGNEIADWMLYTFLFADSLGIDVESYIVKIFNAKSEEYGFPERLGETQNLVPELSSLVYKLGESLGVRTSKRSLLEILRELAYEAQKLKG